MSRHLAREISGLSPMRWCGIPHVLRPTKIDPKVLAETLFAEFIQRKHCDWHPARPRASERLQNELWIEPSAIPAFDAKIRLYQFTSILLAVMGTASTKPEFIPVREHLEGLFFPPTLDTDLLLAVRGAMNDLSDLLDLLTIPEEDRATGSGKSISWARNWLVHLGVEENNPATLFLFALGWMDYYIAVNKSLKHFANQGLAEDHTGLRDLDREAGTLNVEEAAKALFKLMQSDFKPEWRSTLTTVAELDPIRAEDELVFLDFFAVYFFLKFTRSSSWRANGQLVFEKLFGFLATWLADFWAPRGAGTVEDAFKILDARLKVYGAVIEQPSSAEPDQLIQAIGLQYAAYAFADDGIGTPGSRERDAHYDEFLSKLDHHNVVTTIGGEVFNHRIEMLHTWFDSHKVT